MWVRNERISSTTAIASSRTTPEPIKPGLTVLSLQSLPGHVVAPLTTGVGLGPSEAICIAGT